MEKLILIKRTKELKNVMWQLIVPLNIFYTGNVKVSTHYEQLDANVLFTNFNKYVFISNFYKHIHYFILLAKVKVTTIKKLNFININIILNTILSI